MRVTLRDGQRLDLLDASVTGDSLIGEEERAFRLRRRRWALPIGEIANMEVRRFSAGRTIVAMAGTAVVTVLVVRAIEGIKLPPLFPNGFPSPY